MVPSKSFFCLILILPAICSDIPSEDQQTETMSLSTPKAGKQDDERLDAVLYFDDVIVQNERPRKDAKVWDHWGKWSSCSVSCGVGKMTRWRHCISKACAAGDKEAQIKTCTLSPC